MTIRIYEIIVADAGDAEYETLYGDEYRFHGNEESAKRTLKRLQDNIPNCYWGDEGWTPDYKIRKWIYSEEDVDRFMRDGLMYKPPGYKGGERIFYCKVELESSEELPLQVFTESEIVQLGKEFTLDSYYDSDDNYDPLKAGDPSKLSLEEYLSTWWGNWNRFVDENGEEDEEATELYCEGMKLGSLKIYRDALEEAEKA
jgi:hypothetical protein